MGYKDKVIPLNSNKTANLVVLLESDEIQLAEVVVHKGKNHYSKKNNPAVEFMKEVIARKDDNRLEAKPYYKTERYEKFATYLDKSDSKSILFKSKIFSNYVDSSEINGNKVLALSMKETLTDIYYRKSPHAFKEMLNAKREEGVWQEFDDSTNVRIQELFRDVNLYDNSIDLFYNSFVSPLSSTLAMSVYKYYIEDTTMVDNVQCLKMAFFPFNQQSVGFKGLLYFTIDGKYALKKAELHIPEKSNLNFARNLVITQNFTQLADSVWAMSDENLYVNMYLFNGIPELLLQRIRTYRDYNFGYQNDSIFFITADIEADEQETSKSDDYWIANRHIPLKQKEEDGIKKMFTDLRKYPLYRTIESVTNYFSPGPPTYFVANGNTKESKFNIGPLESMVSMNDIEGQHFKLAGLSTANLSKQIFVSGYVAYGVNDRRFKYNAKLGYSFYKKKYHEDEFPLNKISLMYDYDLYSPGAVFQEDKDRFFDTWKVGNPVTKMSYLRRGILTYEKDLSSNFRAKTWLKHQMDEPTGTLNYQLDNNGTITDIPALTTFEWGAELNYKIGRRPYKGRNKQRYRGKSTMILSLSHYAGMKNILGGEYNYQRTEFSAKTNLQMSTFGYIDARLKAGKVWTKSPFPLVFVPNAYQSIIIQPDAFQMMDAMEFVTDQYVSINATYHLNGLLFNRIPGLNLLKLREVVSFNGIYGGLTDRNNPQKTSGLFLLPAGTNPLGSVPYMEVGVGIENIFKILRVDYYRRLNYLGPNSRKGGFLVSFVFTF